MAYDFAHWIDRRAGLRAYIGTGDPNAQLPNAKDNEVAYRKDTTTFGVYQRKAGVWVLPTGGGTGTTGGITQEACSTAISTAVTAHEAATNPHPGYVDAVELAQVLAGYADADDLAPIAAQITTHANAAAPHSGHAPLVHTHAQGDITGLTAALAGKAAATHGHAIADTTGLQTALDGKAPTSHTHIAAHISDSTPAGRTILTAADAGAQRAALSLGSAALLGAGVASGVATLGADGKVPAAQLPAAGSSGGFTPAWIVTGPGALFGLFGDGNPRELADWMSTATSVAGPTPTQIGVTVARCVMFRLPRALSVSAIRLFGVAATTNLYKFAIYNAATGARVWESGVFSSVANAWQSITAGTPFTLAADTSYWWCVTAAAVGTTAGYRSPSPPLHASIFGANASPLGGRAIGMETYAQFAVTGGAFPATLPAIAAAAYSGGATGSVPFAWAEGTAS